MFQSVLFALGLCLGLALGLVCDLECVLGVDIDPDVESGCSTEDALVIDLVSNSLTPLPILLLTLKAVLAPVPVVVLSSIFCSPTFKFF